MIIAMITKTFSIVILYPINIIIGVCESIYSIGYNGLASENIEKKSLTKFFSNMTVMYQAGYLLGSMSAGFIIGAIGVRGALMIDAAAYIAALICISNIPKRIKNASVTVSIRTEIINYLKSIKEGAIFLSHSRGLISIIVLSMPVMIFISLINIIEPAFVQEILKGTEIDFGFVDAALGVGAIIGSFILKYFSSKHKELKFLWLGYLLMACGMMLFGMSQSLFFAILANGLIGVTYTMSLVVYQAILQNASDENYIGRVISSQKLLQNLCASVSLLLIGYLGAIVNYRILVIILASFYFIISFLSFFGLKKMTMPFIQ
jgi:MFS family permease